jgi:Cof subfamily protein (haloacid dehalogenase superfamily)
LRPIAYDVLALDIDGTLLRDDRTVSDRTRAAVGEARRRGVRLVLVTGRRPPAARRVARLLGEGIPLILHNGALIIDGGEIVHSRLLPLETARSVVRHGRAQSPVAHVGSRGEGELWVGAGDARTLSVYSMDLSHPDVRAFPDLESALDRDPVQVMFGGTTDEVLALSEVLSRALPGEIRLEKTLYPSAGTGLLDVLHPGVSKARGLKRLLDLWGVSLKRTLAIGDNWNDEGMLLSVGLGLVMGNADKGLLALGLPVLPTNEEDGVAVAVERYLS